MAIETYKHRNWTRRKAILYAFVIFQIIAVLPIVITLVFDLNKKISQDKKTTADFPIIEAVFKLEAYTILSAPPKMHPPNNFNLDYDYPPVAQPAGTVRIPVLTYHHVAPMPKSGHGRDYYVTPEMFDKQMAYLKEKQYRTLTMLEFYDQLSSGQNPTQKSVLLTFDDGNANNYTNAFPILKKYDFVATFFVVSSRSGITSAQMKEMTNAGMDIESHTQTHPDLVKIDEDSELTNELGGSRSSLSYLSNSQVISVAYPGCTADSQALQQTASSGYLLGFTCGKKIDHRYYGRYVLQREHVYSNLENFKQRLSGVFIYTAVYE